jgi:prepilin-type processing-associated H-X9-DG protein
MTKAKTTPEAINDEALDAVAGGALLLPAVQAAREAASRSTTSVNVLLADGSVRSSTTPAKTGTPG